MASLANQTISSTYDGLIKTSTDQPVGISGVQLLEDGVGNSLALSVGRANQGVTITGTLTATSISGVLADGVTATTQTSGDNSTKVATTAYVDAQVTASDLDFAGDSGTGAVDLDSQSLTIAGTANEIETSASGQTITIGLPSTITANVTGDVTGDLTGTVLTAAQPNITSVGTLTGLDVNGATNNILASFTSTDTAARIQFADDTTSGQVSLGAQGSDFVVFTNSAERMRIDSSGNVGIGESSPNSTLTVSANAPRVMINTGNAAQSMGVLFGLNQSATAGILSDATDENLIFRTGGSLNSDERMRIDSSGNVGIGGTATYKLDVFDTDPVVRVSATNASGTSRLELRGLGSNGTSNAITRITTIPEGSGTASALQFQTRNSGGTIAEAMRIDSSGNVGIGTNNPSDLLTVVGGKATFRGVAISSLGVEIDTISAIPAAQVRAYIAQGTDDIDVAGDLYIAPRTSNNSSIKFITGTTPTERMRITSGGDVLIGKSTTVASVEGIQITKGSEGFVYTSTWSTTSTKPHLAFYNPNGQVGTITTSGSSTAYNTSSDYRLKENVVPMEGALDRVSQLQPSRFNFIADPEKTVDGFLAHEVAEVVPEAVSGEKDAVDEEGNPVYQGIDQSKITPLLTAAIKELKALVGAQQAEIETLKAQING